MKLSALRICAILSLLGIVLPAAAQYQDDGKADRRFYISPMANYNLYDGDRQFDDEIGYQLAIGKIVGRGTNIELHGSFAEAGSEQAGISGSELLSYGVSFLLFQSRKDFPMYGILSINRGEADAADGSGKAKSDQFDVGLGYLWSLGSWPLIGSGSALRIEARYRTDKYSASQASTYGALYGVDNDRTYQDAVFALGLFIPLGGDPNAQKEAVEPSEPSARIVITQPDSDGDQIPDEMDACPGTPTGAVINAQGCEHDSDKDGVPNSKDACPATPAGKAVGDDGCMLDADSDGVMNDADQCPRTPRGLAVLADGCAAKGDCRVPSAGQRIDANGCAADS